MGIRELFSRDYMQLHRDSLQMFWTSECEGTLNQKQINDFFSSSVKYLDIAGVKESLKNNPSQELKS